MSEHPGNKDLFELFRQKVEIPDRTQKRLENAYDEVRRSCRMKEDNILPIHKRHCGRTVIAAAAVVTVLAGSALAAGLTHTDFIQSVFGSGISGREEETVTNPWGSAYTLPASEREDVDAERAEAIIGSYIAEAGTTVEANGFTFTINSYVTDLSGIACLTYTLENPLGLDILHDAGGGEVSYYDEDYEAKGFRLVEPLFAAESGAMLDSRTYLDAGRSTDTKAALVVYVTPFGAVAADDGIIMKIMGYAENDDKSLAPPVLATIMLPASAKVAGMEFSGGDITATISPVGIMVTSSAFADGDCQVRDLRIKYSDGSTYVVESEDPYIHNASVSSADGKTIWEAFNRLVDVDKVTSVIVNGSELTPLR
jgi:hypothetical protein